MWRSSLPALLMLCAAAAPATGQVSAEHLFRRGTVAVSLSAGGAAFSDFQRANARPEAGVPQFERRVSAGTTGAVGADLMWWLGGPVGVRAHLGFMPSRFAVKHDQAGEAWLRAQSGTPQAPVYGLLRVWVADVSVLIRPPFTLGRVAPYAMVGAGAVSYHPQSSRALPPEAEAAFDDGARTSPAAVLGLGAAVPLQRGNLVLSFGLTNHLTRSPVRDQGSLSLHDEQSGLVLDPLPAASAVAVTSNVRMMVGITAPLRSR